MVETLPKAQRYATAALFSRYVHAHKQVVVYRMRLGCLGSLWMIKIVCLNLKNSDS